MLNSALSGVDTALWDIAGKRAGMPVYELLGGRLRGAVPVYVHASGATIEDTVEHAAALYADGFRHLRLQTGQPGRGGYGAGGMGGCFPDKPTRTRPTRTAGTCVLSGADPGPVRGGPRAAG